MDFNLTEQLKDFWLNIDCLWEWSTLDSADVSKFGSRYLNKFNHSQFNLSL